MKPSPAERDALTQILTRIYTDLFDIEKEFNLLVGGGDVRPRIEYFHDAVRVFTSGHDPDHRLSVELLAHDLSSLRHLSAAPLSHFHPHERLASPETVPMTLQHNALSVKRHRPDRAVREHISEAYQRYSVIFAALLKPTADYDFNERTDNLNQDVKDLHAVSHEADKLLSGKGNEAGMANAANHLEEEALREQLLKFIQQGQHKKKDNLKKLISFLKQHAASKDKEIANIDQAHMQYAMHQLGIFENSKDMLKKMASQGMNLVGKFVQASIAQSQRQMGR